VTSTDRARSEVGPEVDVIRFDPEVALPAYAHAGDAGADLVSTVDIVLGPGERAVVGTGIGIALPDGYAGFVHPRSGLAARHGLTIVNAPGTVDAGYRGEIKVILLNTDPTVAVDLRRGDRIAQLVIQPVARAVFRPVAELADSARGAGGLGSTGGHTAAADVAAAADAGTAGGMDQARAGRKDGTGVSARA
jgi:dUTP pyrophosphatase